MRQPPHVQIQSIASPPPDSNQWIVFCRDNHVSDRVPADIRSTIRQAIDAGWFRPEEGNVVPVLHRQQVVVLVGATGMTGEHAIRPTAEAVKQAVFTPPMSAGQPIRVVPPDGALEWVRGIVDGCALGLYQWQKYRSDADGRVYQISVVTSHHEWLNRCATVADGVSLARDCANENADIATGEALADLMKSEVEGNPAFQVDMLNRTDLEHHGLHLHLAVNQGSDKEPRLVIIRYTGAGKDDPYTAIVGKGITFDTGGLNLKPTGNIESMRMDMGGAAAVIGTLQNIRRLAPRRNLYFVCGFAENAIGPHAYKPGDVFPSYAGKTVEILNTDAEGRLVLADANAFVARNYKPQSIINIATLTGAVVMALGYEHIGLMASHDSLAEDLLAASRRSDDWAWRLPIYPQLANHVKSTIADIRNTGQRRSAGSISAGEFLRQFAQFESTDLQWAHLDIAGAAKPKESVSCFNPGATGAGVRLLTEYCLR